MFRVCDCPPEDYVLYLWLLEQAQPDVVRSLSELALQDRTRPHHCQHQKLLIWSGDAVVGACLLNQPAGMYQAGEFLLQVWLHPDHTNPTLYKTALEVALNNLKARNASLVCLEVFANQTMQQTCLKTLGFCEHMRFVENRLDLETTTPREATGVSLATSAGFVLSDLQAQCHDPAHRQKYHALWQEIRMQVATPLRSQPVDFDLFCAWVFEDEYLLQEGVLLALDHTGAWVGLCELWATSGAYVQTGYTGVLPAHRGKKLAQALKLSSIDFAKKHGYLEVRSENEASNSAMLAINARLGFVQQPARMWWRKTL